MKRSHEALRARDRGRSACSAPYARGMLELPETAWTPMLRDLGARLVPPAPQRPYWSVYRATTYLAAARTPRDAICRAAFAALDQRSEARRPTSPRSPLTPDRSVRDKTTPPTSPNEQASDPRRDPRSGIQKGLVR